MASFTHIDETGNPGMVDVGDKATTKRTARAQSVVILPREIMEAMSDDEIMTKKGPVFQTAIIAGVMAAKKTGELIPMCHPVGLDNCKITIKTLGSNELIIECTASVTAKTGVEMEALTGASVAALTVYDMCKSFSKGIVIKETKLIEKTGGKSDFAVTYEIPPLSALILVGGKSVRMGSDKSRLVYHGKPQYEYVASLAEKAGLTPYFSCRSDQSSFFEERGKVVADVFLGMGPYGAILSAFREQPCHAWLVVACDLPLLDLETLEELIKKRDPLKCATAFKSPHDGLPEPLITIWEPRSYEILLTYLSKGITCPRKVLILEKTPLLEPSYPDALSNVNRPEEFEATLKKLSL